MAKRGDSYACGVSLDDMGPNRSGGGGGGGESHVGTSHVIASGDAKDNQNDDADDGPAMLEIDPITQTYKITSLSASEFSTLTNLKKVERKK